MFKDIITAIQFLTRIPLPKISIDEKSFGRAMRYFPLVGLLIGEFLVLANIVLERYLPQRLENLFILVVLILITGAFHLDGFADTVDAFFSSKSKEDMLRIMKDSRIGAIGAVGLVILLLAKFELLNAVLPEKKNIALLIMPVISRWGMAVSAFSLPYARTEKGLGGLFAGSITKFDFFVSTAMMLVIVYGTIGVASVAFIFLNLFLISTLMIYSRSKIGGGTGDVIGFISEIVEIFVLLLFVMKVV